MANTTLRELAKEHASGNLDKDSYRKSRAELIQGITAGAIPVKEVNYPPPVQPPEPEDLDVTQRKDENKNPPAKKAEPQASTPPKPETGESSVANACNDTGKSNQTLLIGLSLAVVGIIIVVVFLLKGTDNSDTAASTATGTEIPAGNTSAAAATTKTDTLIQGFLENKNWSDSSLGDFRQQWTNLSTDEMQAAKGSLALGQLTNAIYKQLVDERALSGLMDDDSALHKQRQLVQFATELGIEDNRISLPDMPEAMEKLEP